MGSPEQDKDRRRARRLAAAGFGAALTLPFAASAEAMRPADGGPSGVTEPDASGASSDVPQPADPKPVRPTAPRHAPAPTGSVPAQDPLQRQVRKPAAAPKPKPQPTGSVPAQDPLQRQVVEPKPVAPAPTGAVPAQDPVQRQVVEPKPVAPAPTGAVPAQDPLQRQVVKPKPVDPAPTGAVPAQDPLQRQVVKPKPAPTGAVPAQDPLQRQVVKPPSQGPTGAVPAQDPLQRQVIKPPAPSSVDLGDGSGTVPALDPLQRMGGPSSIGSQVQFTPQPGTYGLSIGPHQGINPGLPFPGSVTITCTESGNPAKGPCGMPRRGVLPEGGKAGATVTVTVDGSVTSTRSGSTLGEDGTRRVTLDVTTMLKLLGKAGLDGKHLGISGSVFGGHSTTYQVTVSASRADDLTGGDAEMPNPYDPRSMAEGDGIQLSTEAFYGAGGELTFEHALKLGTEHERGHKVSAGVQRLGGDTVRVIVGDEDSVGNALSLGVGGDNFGAALSTSTALGDGHLKFVDLDLSTPQGWSAYQRFVGNGEVPAVTKPNQPGIVDAATADSTTWTGGASASVRGGPLTFTVGGTSYEGDATRSVHPDGTIDDSITARSHDVTMRTTATTDADGSGGNTYSLSLKDMDPAMAAKLHRLQQGDDVDYDGNQDASMSFTANDLLAIQRDTLDALAWQTKQSGAGMSTREIHDALRADPSANIPVIGSADPDDTSVAAARTPREILGALYAASDGDPDKLAVILMRTHIGAGMASGENGWDSTAPGSLTVYDR